MITAQPHGGAAHLSVWTLADGVLLLVWEAAPSDARVRYRPIIDGRAASAPFAHIAATTATGGERHLLAFRGTAAAAIHPPIEVRTTDAGANAIARTAAGAADRADANFVLSGLNDGGRFQASRFFVETLVSLFKLGNERSYVAFCLDLFGEVFERALPLAAHCRLSERWIVAECALQASFSEPMRAIVIGGGSVRSLPPTALTLNPVTANGERKTLALMLPAAVADTGAAVIVLNNRASTGRLLAPRQAPVPAAAAWLAAGGAAVKRLTPVLLDAAARLANDDPAADAVACELAMIAAGDASAGISAHVNLVASGTFGVLITGWLEDREGLVVAIDCERLGATQTFTINELPRFAHPEGSPDPHRGGRLAADAGAAFAVVVPWGEQPGPRASIRLWLRLTSGSRQLLWQGQPAPTDTALLERILVTMPASDRGECIDGDDDDAMLAMIEPWLRSEQADRASRVAAHRLIGIGKATARPQVSVVVPLGDDAQLLRCTVTTVATASRRHALEVVFVADRERLQSDQLRLLRGLAHAFGLSGRLAVIDRVSGPGSLLNGGAVAAEAPILVLLGAGVIAEGADWLDRLVAAVHGADGRCLAGARIVGADHGIRDAGYVVAEDAFGGLDLVSEFEGFPRDFRQLAQMRLVDGVSTAAMAMSREAFEAAGGFDDRYFTCRYRDADFCLEFGRQGGHVLALSEPVMFELGTGRDGDRRARVRAGAALLDRRLLTQRWRDRERSALPDVDEAVGADSRLEVAA